jgi:hypothetical protein
MAPISIGLSDSKSTATQFGSVGPNSFAGGNTNAPNWIMWVVIGVVALFGVILFLKKKRGRR